jgi:protocatechuate 3,4-dioxygenase beta subunit
VRFRVVVAVAVLLFLAALTAHRVVQRLAEAPAAPTRPAPTARAESGTRGVARAPSPLPISEVADPPASALPETAAEDALPAAPTGNQGTAPLEPGSASLVLVVRTGSGEPLPGLSVSLRGLPPAAGVEAVVTDRFAEAHFPSLAPGRYRYTVDALEHGRGAGAVLLREREDRRLVVLLAARDLSILGRVVDAAGAPLGGIRVSATRRRFASPAEEAGGSSTVSPVLSKNDGSFVLRGLAAGEYDVTAGPTDWLARAHATAQAGAEGIELVLFPRLMITGRVLDERALPLSGVEVRLRGEPPASDDVTRSREDGTYAVHSDRSSQGTQRTLRFFLAGYETHEVLVAGDAAGGVQTVDVQLEPIEDVATVSGRVRTERGDPVVGASVTLVAQTGQQRHQARTDAEGRFVLPGVEAEASYTLAIAAGSRFRDHVDNEIWVTRDLPPLDVVVEPLAIGRLTGRMVDSEGRPVPGFRLWLVSVQSVRAAIPVTSDGGGYFTVEEAPAGSLQLDTRGAPRLVVRGLTVPAGGEADVRVVLDTGSHALTGAVLDDRGRAVPGARVELAWASTAGSGESSSTRATRASPQGRFAFSALGPGTHVLRVQAEGRAPTETRWDPARDASYLEVRIGSPKGSSTSDNPM